jgi:AraC-like DNA-binding protein
MKHNEAKPFAELAPYIHSFWELKGDDSDGQWERIFPDGCSGIVMNLGASCKTDNGLATMDHGKTYVVGAMTSFKDSFIDKHTHLLGVCLKPAAFSSFYNYAPQNELTDHTFEFDLPHSFDIGKINNDPNTYLNSYFLDRKRSNHQGLQPVLNDIHMSKGKLSIYEISKRNFTTVRQLERIFKTHIGLTPKEYVKIIRFQSALAMMSDISQKKSLSDIAFECGFYDHAHLSNEIKRHTGLTPSQL